MSKIDAMLAVFDRLVGASQRDVLQPGWLDVVDDALAGQGYYLAPIAPAGGNKARTTDPRTSHVAAHDIRLKAGTQRHKLLATFGRWPDDGLTDEQAMEKSQGVSPTSEYATRCSEMRRAGWIRETGRERKGNSGTERIVSRITDAGIAELRRIQP